jgi:ATP-dependent helicase/nuclease subunit B
MNSFVDRIAADLAGKNIDFGQTTIIVPSERMINYLQRALFLVDEKPKVSPRIITIDRWVQQLSKRNSINKTVALFELYELFLRNPVEHEMKNFDGFLNWGQLLLSDFDEIDRYLVDPKTLFRNLKDVKELESWSFSGEELSEGQKKFMAFWDKLGPYYFAYEERLNQLNVWSKGKAYREVANRLPELIDHDQYYVLAGFNALSLAELSIFKQLKTFGKTSFYFDNDAYYLNDKLHEAGYFQRKIFDYLELKTNDSTLNLLATKELSIDVVECAQSTDQAAVIGSELKKLDQEALNSTLLLLADETQLKSMLHNLPSSIGKANITLGLPLKNTALRTWVDLIFQLQEGLERYGRNAVYYKILSNFIHHPFLEATLPKRELFALNKLESEAVQKNWHFIKRSSISDAPIVEQLLELLTTPWSRDWKKGLESIQELNYYLDAHFNEENEYEQTLIRSFTAAVQSLMNLFDTVEMPEMAPTTFKRLFEMHWSSENMAYYGNPLNGIQIMGLLETRGLDFKNVFVLGLNEGAMPPTNPIQTLIPMDLRRYFGMPVPRDKQGLFAHHFYRLLHNAERLLVTYTTSSEDLGSAEPSRFLKQIEMELLPVNPNIKYNKYQVSTANQEQIGDVVIEKSPEIIQRLEELVEKGLSFSKLTKFLTCPLDFYYQTVLKLGEEDKIEEDLESSTQGSILHYVMEKLLEDFAERFDEHGKLLPHRNVSIDDFKAMKNRVPLLVEEGFKECFNDDPDTWQQGTNFIQYEMIKESIQAALNREIAILEENLDQALFILQLEEELSSDIPLMVNGREMNVNFKGIIDRIDRLGGKIRIIDYKSGKVDSSKLNVFGSRVKLPPADQIISKFKKDDKTHALQLMLYAYLLQTNSTRTVDRAGIVSFINHKSSPVYLDFDLSLESVTEILTEVFNKIFAELFDTSQPFRHNPKASYCAYCNNVKKGF